MADRKVTVFRQHVRDLSKAEGSLLLSCAVYPHVINRMGKSLLMGHYISLKKGTPLFFDPNDQCHFVGVHECLCMTVRRPISCKDMLSIATKVREIPPFGQVAWLGAVTIRSWQKNTGAVGRIYVPSSVWKPPNRIIGKRIRVSVIVHELSAKCTNGQFRYKLMEFPAFQRDEILDQYIVE